MQQKQTVAHLPYALASLVFVLSACGGSSGGDGIAAIVPDVDTNTPADMSGDTNTPGGDTNTPQNPTSPTGGSSDTVIVALSSLGPLKDRMYPGTPNTSILTGPIVGEGKLENAELIYDLPFETQGTDIIEEVVVETAYLVRNYSRSFGELDFDQAIPQLFVILTNVSNKMMCDVYIDNVSLELTNGETIKAGMSVNGPRGFATVEDESENFVSDRFAFDCIPAGHSVAAYASSGGGQVQEVLDEAGNPGDVEVVTKVVIEKISGRQKESYILITDGLHAASYELSEDGNTFPVSLVNDTSRDVRNERGTKEVHYIDVATSLPIAIGTLTIVQGVDLNDITVILPGEVISDYYRLQETTFIGSTNSLIVYPVYSDDNSR